MTIYSFGDYGSHENPKAQAWELRQYTEDTGEQGSIWGSEDTEPTYITPPLGFLLGAGNSTFASLTKPLVIGGFFVFAFVVLLIAKGTLNDIGLKLHHAGRPFIYFIILYF